MHCFTYSLLDNFSIHSFPLSFEPLKCIKRPFQILTKNFNCQNDRNLVMAKLMKYRFKKNQIIKKFNNVSNFDIDDILCDKLTCKAINNNILMYYDKTHLNPNGVKFVRNRISLKQFLQETL